MIINTISIMASIIGNTYYTFSTHLGSTIYNFNTSFIGSFNEIINGLLVTTLIYPLIYYTIIIFTYLIIDRVFVKIYLEKIGKKLFNKIINHIKYGYFVRFNLHSFIKFNFTILFIIYTCNYPYLTLFLALFFILYHLNLTFKTVCFQIEFYNINLSYFIMKIYRFVKRTSYYCLEQLKSYKIQRDSWLKKIFKYMFYICVAFYLLNENTTVELLLANPLSLSSSLSTPLTTLDDATKQKLLEASYKQKLLELSEISAELLKVKKYNYETLDYLYKPSKETTLYLPLPRIHSKIVSRNDNHIRYSVTGFTLDESVDEKKQLEVLYNTIMYNESFRNLSKTKKMLLLGVSDFVRTNYHPVHSSVVLTNNTTFEEYYNKITDYMYEHWFGHYEKAVSTKFIVIVTNADLLEKKTISINKKNKIQIRQYSTMIEKPDDKPITDPKPKLNKFSIRPLRNTKVKTIEKLIY